MSGIKKNIVFGFLTWLLPFGLSICATPIVVHGLGAEQYGIFALLVGFISYSFNFSIGRAATKYISEFQAAGDESRLTEVVSSTLLICLTLGAAGALLLALLAPYLVDQVLHIPTSSRDGAVMGFYWAAATIFILMASQVYAGVVQAIHRFDVYAKINVGGIMLYTMGNIVLAWSGFSFLYLLAWFAITTLLAAIAYFLAGRYFLPAAETRFIYDREIMGKILRFGAGIMLTQVFSNILLLYEYSLITAKLGSESLTYYAVPLTIGVQIHGLCASLLLFIFPMVSALDARSEIGTLSRLYFRSVKFIFVLVAALILVFVVFGKSLLTLWMGPDFAEQSYVILGIHAVNFGILAVLIISWQLIEGRGKPHLNSVAMIAQATLAMIMMTVLIGPYGLVGIGFGRMAGATLFLLYILLVECWTFGRVHVWFWMRLIGILILASGVAGVIGQLWLKNVNNGLAGLVSGGAMSMAVFAVILLLIRLFDQDEIEWLRDFLKGARGRLTHN